MLNRRAISQPFSVFMITIILRGQNFLMHNKQHQMIHWKRKHKKKQKMDCLGWFACFSFQWTSTKYCSLLAYVPLWGHICPIFCNNQDSPKYWINISVTQHTVYNISRRRLFIFFLQKGKFQIILGLCMIIDW